MGPSEEQHIRMSWRLAGMRVPHRALAEDSLGATWLSHELLPTERARDMYVV